MPVIRRENKDDPAAIHKLNQSAFRRSDEADLVDSLRSSGKAVLSLVAEYHRQLIGHIFFSPAHIQGHEARIAALAPMAIIPDYQRTGVGTLLMRQGVRTCREMGFDAIIVLGYPGFYSKFHFKPASQYGIQCPYDDVPDEAFMVLELNKGALKGISGTACYAEEFAALA